MKKTNFLITMIIGIFVFFCMPVVSNAANENLSLVKQAENEYIIYLKEYLNNEFEFAFSNDEGANISTLTFNNSALDAPNDNANNIAYVNDATVTMFANPTYMWVKVNGEVKVTATEINLEDYITKNELENVGKTSTIIPINLGQKQIVNEIDENGTKKTETVGIVEVQKELVSGQYQLIKREYSEKTDKLFALAELIEKNEFTDVYTKIKSSKEFVELYNEQYSLLNAENWQTVEGLTIEQPIDAKTGDQYILWIKEENSQDIHFLTSYREYDEEYIQEEIKQKLPYTYDDNTMLIALGAVVIAILFVVIRIVILKKKEMMNKQ